MGDNFDTGSGESGSTQARSAAELTQEDADLAKSLDELGQLATAELPLQAMLTKVAEYAVLAIPGAEGAGLTLIAKDRSETLVATTPFVSEVDAIQYGIRQGPCISAASEAVTVLSHALGDDKRWPQFGAQVAELGVNSALSLPLLASDRVVGAMNIYARRRNAFDARSAAVGQLFAAPAAIAVQNGQVLAAARALVARLEEALETRAVIDRAIGFMIGRQRISAVEAKRRLRSEAREGHASLREVAEATLRRAEWRNPTTPGPDDRPRRG
jgi:GAF domain-containing protein